MNSTDTQRIPIASSVISAVAHDGDQTLTIEFVSGAIYQYFEVPPLAFRALLDAESKGVFFNHHIRPRFRYQRTL